MPVARKVWQLAAMPREAWRTLRLTIAEDIDAVHAVGSEASAPPHRAPQRGTLLIVDPSHLEVGIEILLGVVVGGILVDCLPEPPGPFRPLLDSGDLLFRPRGLLFPFQPTNPGRDSGPHVRYRKPWPITPEHQEDGMCGSPRAIEIPVRFP